MGEGEGSSEEAVVGEGEGLRIVVGDGVVGNGEGSGKVVVGEGGLNDKVAFG